MTGFSERGVSATALKFLALLSMTLDHIGYFFFPQALWLRAAGRLAFPVFAYFLAEGARYTRHPRRYLGSVLLLGLLCSAVSFFAAGNRTQSIFITFASSLGLIFLLRRAKAEPTPGHLAAAGGAALCLFLLFGTPLVPSLSVDYGFLGILTPVGVYFAEGRREKLSVLALFLTLLTAQYGAVQLFSLLAVPLLALYRGERGRCPLKWLFYAYYPLHLAALYALSAW